MKSVQKLCQMGYAACKPFGCWLEGTYVANDFQLSLLFTVFLSEIDVLYVWTPGYLQDVLYTSSKHQTILIWQCFPASSSDFIELLLGKCQIPWPREASFKKQEKTKDFMLAYVYL